MTITPVTPKHQERLVPVGTGILIDFIGESAQLVVVNNVTVWNGSPQAGWTALVLTRPGGTRLVLDPPSPFSVAATVRVAVTGTVSSSSYLFSTALRQITTTDDASSPRIVQTTGPLPPAVAPLIHLSLDDAFGPPVDQMGNFVFSQSGSPAFGQAGAVDDAVSLTSGAHFKTSTPDGSATIHEIEIDVTNTTMATLTDISVDVSINTAALVSALKMNPNCYVRILNSLDVDMAYWLEGPANSATTKYWFKIPSLPVGTSTFRMQFGFSIDYSSYEDKDNVFLFFDDFDGPTNPQWTTVSGTPSYASSVLTLDNGEGLFANGFILDDDTVIETKADPLSTSRGSGAVRAATSTGSGFVSDGGANIEDILWWFGTLYAETNSGENSFGSFSTGMKVYTIKHRIGGADSSQFIYDGGVSSTFRSGTQSGVLKPVIYASGGSSSWDWVRVYKNIDTKVTKLVSSDSPVGTVPVPANPDDLKLQEFSVDLWYKPSTLTGNQVLASSGRGTNKGWVLRMLSGGTVEFRAWDGSSSAAATSTSSLTTSAMHHVGVAFDAAGGDCRLFVDGQKEFDADLGISPVAYQYTGAGGDDDLVIGKDTQTPSDTVSGLVDDLMYYESALVDTYFSSRYQAVNGVDRVQWVGYSREPDNIHLRKDDPLTSEVLVVPGSVLDVGYNEVRDEIEIMYIHNGKVFVTYGGPNETPSTLVQPSVLKDALRSGHIGDSKSSDNNAPLPPVIAPLNAPPSPVTLIIPAVSSTVAVGYEIWRVNAGRSIRIASIPYVNDSQVFTDNAWASGDGYKIRTVYRDPGAPERRRSGPFGGVVFPSGAGDVLVAGFVSSGEKLTIQTLTFMPIKISKTDTLITGNTGKNEDLVVSTVTFTPKKILFQDSFTSGTNGGNQDGSGFSGVGYFPAGSSASMSAAVGGHVVLTGLSDITYKHRHSKITLSAAASSLNNGSFRIVDVISSSSVRISAPVSPGSDANNGTIDWSIDFFVAGDSLISRSYNTLDIGIG